jgi:hypothetical protein
VRTGLTIAELQRQARQLNEAKGFEITLEQWPAIPHYANLSEGRENGDASVQ